MRDVHILPRPGCVEVVGVLGCAGVMLWAAWLTGYQGPDTEILWMFVGIAGAFGLAATSLRLGVTISPARGIVRKWVGLRFPLVRVPLGWKTRRLDEFNEVSFRREWRGDGNSSSIVYVVALEGGGKPVTFHDCTTHDEARSLGERVAGVLKLPLRDAMQETHAPRPAESLDQSVVDRMRARGQRPTTPRRPARTLVRGEGGSFSVPAPGGGHRGFWPAFVGSTLAAVLLLELAATPSPPTWVVAGVAGAAAIVLLATSGRVLRVLRIAGYRERLVIDAAELRHERATFLKARTRALPRHDVEELFVGTPTNGKAAREYGRSGKRVLVARGDAGTLEFGSGLPEEELEWVRDEILVDLYGKTPRSS